MRYLKYGLLTVSFILLPCFSRVVQACECLQSPPACAAYRAADAVFAGLVTSVSPENNDYKTIAKNGKRKVTFTLINAYRGVSGKEIEIQSTISSCEYQFRKGEKYFVYASLDTSDNSLGTSGCSRTTRLSSATEDLAFINSLSGGRAGRLISGIVSESTYTPVKNVKVLATGNGKQYQAETDDKGRFNIFVGKSGKYVVRVVLPRNSGVVGLKHQLDQISRMSMNDDQVTVEYDVHVGVGKCAYIDVPIYLFRESP